MRATLFIPLTGKQGYVKFRTVYLPQAYALYLMPMTMSVHSIEDADWEATPSDPNSKMARFKLLKKLDKDDALYVFDGVV